jgi:hypothetical protein
MKNKIFTSLAVIGVALLFYFSVSAFTGNEKHGDNANIKPIETFLSESDIASLQSLKAINTYTSGQRLIYEVNGRQNDHETNEGFCYSRVMPDVFTIDSGRTVLHPVPVTNNSGYLCRDIYENLQHSDIFEKGHDDGLIWYVKPVMRIKPGLPDGIPVARIEMISYNGEEIDIELKTENFRDYMGNYRAEYLDKYYGLPVPQSLCIMGNNGKNGLTTGIDRTPALQKSNCKVDFRVYWYGQVELWCDKMIVDDLIANELFDPINEQTIAYRIAQEEKYYNPDNTENNFLKREISASQVPCIKNVMSKMNIFERNNGSLSNIKDGIKYCGLLRRANSEKMFLNLLRR